MSDEGNGFDKLFDLLDERLQHLKESRYRCVQDSIKLSISANIQNAFQHINHADVLVRSYCVDMIMQKSDEILGVDDLLLQQLPREHDQSIKNQLLLNIGILLDQTRNPMVISSLLSIIVNESETTQTRAVAYWALMLGTGQNVEFKKTFPQDISGIVINSDVLEGIKRLIEDDTKESN